MCNISSRPNARKNLEQQGFIPVLVKLLQRREEFTKEELGLKEEEEEDSTGKVERITLMVQISSCLSIT